MIPSYRKSFNSNFTPEKYERLRREMASRCGMEIPFAVSETPCFFPGALVERMGEINLTAIEESSFTLPWPAEVISRDLTGEHGACQTNTIFTPGETGRMPDD